MSLDTVKKEGNIKGIRLSGNKLKRSILSVLTTNPTPRPLPLGYDVPCVLLPFLSPGLSSLCVPADGRGRGQETSKTTAKEPLLKYFLYGVQKFTHFKIFIFYSHFCLDYFYVTLFNTA
jgi:hypothetical protein